MTTTSDWLHRSGTGKVSNAPSGRFSRKPRVSIPASLYTETTPGAFLAECLDACNSEEQQDINNSRRASSSGGGGIFSSRLRPYQNKSSRLDPANDFKPLPPTPLPNLAGHPPPLDPKRTTVGVVPVSHDSAAPAITQQQEEEPLSQGGKRWLPKSLSRRAATKILLTILVISAILILIGVCVHVAREPSINKEKAHELANGGGNNDYQKRGKNKKASSKRGGGDDDDVSRWYETTDFNTTYTQDKVSGLPIIGLFSKYNDDARPHNKVAPPLKDQFLYGINPIHGINLGGWLVLEPFITPSLFNESSHEKKIERHYATFIAENDFRQISEAGFDHVRIPYRHDDDDAKVSWKYLLRGIEYARKYGLRVNLDVHGHNTLRLHEQLGEFFAQERYQNVVTMYSLVNEAKMIGDDDLVVEWTRKVYKRLRHAGFNNHIVFGDGSKSRQYWKGKLPHNEYPDMILDIHQYLVFDADLIRLTHSGKIDFACKEWAGQMRMASDPDQSHGAAIVGEWSQADTDCAPHVNNIGQGSRWMGTLGGTSDVEGCPGGQACDCESTMNPLNYSKLYKKFLYDFAIAQIQTFNNNSWGQFYWTWKTETDEAAQWSWKRARHYHFIPKDAADSALSNVCRRIPNYPALGLPETF